MFASTHGPCSTGTQGEAGDMREGDPTPHSLGLEGRQMRVSCCPRVSWPDPLTQGYPAPAYLARNTTSKKRPALGCSQAKGDVAGTFTFWGWGQRQSGRRIHRHQVFSQQVVPGSTGLDSYTMRTWAGWPRGIAHSAGTDMNNRKERSLFPQLNILGPGPTEAVERSQYMTARSCPQFPHLKPKLLCTLV